MKLVKVDRIPDIKQKEFKRPKQKIGPIIDEFIESDLRYAKVEFDDWEYVGPHSLYMSLVSHIVKRRVMIDVFIRGNNVYLAK